MGYERPNIRRMKGYAYGEQPTDARVIKLNTNESAYPPSPAVAAALASFEAESLRRYPPAMADDLCAMVAERLGVEPGQVMATNGGDEGLRLAITTFVDPGETFGMAEPSYSLYPVLAAVQDATMCAVPLAADWTPPACFAERLNAAGARLACLVNPHAPSGRLLDASAIAALAKALHGVLLVDEAYVDFVDPGRNHDLAPLVSEHPNLLLLRTLSKGYALAGLRVGFLIGDAGLIEPIRTKTRDSFNVDALAQTLAAAAYADAAYAAQCWRSTRTERDRVTAALRRMGFAVPDSETNFVLATATADGPPAKTLFESLRDAGILVRYFDSPRLADRLRITIGQPAENDALLRVLAHMASGSD